MLPPVGMQGGGVAMVLVTGGAGFIGSHLVDGLVERGDDVVVIDDLATGLAGNVAAAARFVEADVGDEVALAKAVDGCDVVFHQRAGSSPARGPCHPGQRSGHRAAGWRLSTRPTRGVARCCCASSSSCTAV